MWRRSAVCSCFPFNAVAGEGRLFTFGAVCATSGASLLLGEFPACPTVTLVLAQMEGGDLRSPTWPKEETPTNGNQRARFAALLPGYYGFVCAAITPPNGSINLECWTPRWDFTTALASRENKCQGLEHLQRAGGGTTKLAVVPFSHPLLYTFHLHLLILSLFE